MRCCRRLRRWGIRWGIRAMAEAAYGSLPFAEQLAFFRAKLNVPTQAWTDMWQAQHDFAFVVAGANRDAIVADFRAAVEAAIAGGSTLEGFRKEFDAIVEKHGWSYHGGRNWRSRVIYDTNLSTSYAAGRFEQLQAAPFWQYEHADWVTHPRHQHKAWDGLVLARDDPFWQSHFPPNGWGCKCSVRGLWARDLKRLGKEGPDEAPAVRLVEREVGQNSPNGPRVVLVPEGIDPGFAYTPGRARLEAREELERSHIAQQVASPAFDAFFNNHPGSTNRFAMALLSSAERALFNVKQPHVWLSRTSLDEHKERHPEIGVDDYRQIAEIIAKGEVWSGHAERRYLLLWVNGKPYRAAVKVDAKNREMWFLSLVISGKQKPPKGAVRLREQAARVGDPD